MTHFEIGDRVYFGKTGPMAVPGQGVIVSFSNRSVGVELDEMPSFYGHNLDGEIQSNKGWWFDPEYLTLVSRLPSEPATPWWEKPNE